MGAPSDLLLKRAAVAEDALIPAFAAKVIERENGTIRFTHPLLSSVLYQDLGEQRHGFHERVAGAVDEPLLHARHLALSTESPNGRLPPRSTTPRDSLQIAAHLLFRPSSRSTHFG